MQIAKKFVNYFLDEEKSDEDLNLNYRGILLVLAAAVIAFGLVANF